MKQDPRTRNKVAIFSDPSCEYSSTPPYHPNSLYPEYPFGSDFIDRENESKLDAYQAVRQTLYLLGFDRNNFGSAIWNPLGEIIQPGQKVVIKPNFVLHLNEGGHDIFANLTHPSVLRVIADYCYIALKGKGALCIAEAPQMDCEFDKIESLMNLQSLTKFYLDVAKFDLPIFDVRRLICKRDYQREYYPASSFHLNPSPDPRGYAIIDLDSQSFLEGLSGIENIYGADFNRTFTSANHNRGTHKYCVSRTILEADTIICVPKMKTHKKVGVTLNIKLLVGINGDKNYLAHFRVGSPSQNGDEFPDTEKMELKLKRNFMRFLMDRLMVKRSLLADWVWLTIRNVGKPVMKVLRKVRVLKTPTSGERIQAGNWYGNDTAWRMATDLAHIITYADKQGNIQNGPQRSFFSIVDGIIAGEGEGPMASKPKPIGTLIAGENILAVDTATATFMGFDYKRIKMLERSWNSSLPKLVSFSQKDTEIISNLPELNGKKVDDCRKYFFSPHSHWKGFIEN